MKTLILCGGLGMRLREETEFRPKPMVEIGGRPILWHIMRHYSKYDFNDFVLCLGYKGEVIRNYFLNYRAMNTDVRVDLGAQRLEYLDDLEAEERAWRITLVDTGDHTLTGGRILRAAERYCGNEPFLCTYGDGVSNVDLRELLRFHRERGRLVTLTGVRPSSRYGELDVVDGLARGFQEKPRVGAAWANGGYFVFEPGALQYLDGDGALEREPLERLARDGQLAVFGHDGYWAAMDTYRDMVALNEEWSSGGPGWVEAPHHPDHTMRGEGSGRMKRPPASR